MKYFRNIVLIMAAGMAITSCSDWDDHYNGSDSGTSQTLWELMQERSDLSNFCEVLQNTKIFRHHKRTSVSYADLLSGGQSFTVFAPANGTFNKDSLLRLVTTDKGDSSVAEFFVKNHLASAPNSAFSEVSEIRLLNTKRIDLGNGEAGSVAITDPNIRAKNGILHCVATQLPYQYNIYEEMTNVADFTPVGDFIRKYDEDYFNEDASLSSGTVDGIPVYVDSVITERNRLLEKIGLINSEDSTYWMVVPTKAGFNQAYATAQQYFVYDKTVDHRDSIQQYWAHRALLDDGIYDMNIQPSYRDSLISVQYNSRNPKYHVFYQPLSTILSGAEKVSCSNGIVYKTQVWPFTPEQTYFQEVLTQGESTGYITAYTLCSYNARSFSADSVSGTGYLDIVPTTSTSNWTMTFKVQNTLAGKYDVCAVLLPKSVYNDVDPDLRPCKFKATVTYVDTLGNSKSYNCGNNTFISDPLKVDTVVLASGFTFPACNYDQDNLKITVKLQCSILARETSTYNREMFLDCIYLRPSTLKEE